MTVTESTPYDEQSSTSSRAAARERDCRVGPVARSIFKGAQWRGGGQPGSDDTVGVGQGEHSQDVAGGGKTNYDLAQAVKHPQTKAILLNMS